MLIKGIIAFITSYCIFISLVGCTNNALTQNFDEAKAIATVIKDHPDFPSGPSDTISKKLPIGGKQGATANVKFTTKIDKAGESTYVVTLTKDWGITVNGEFVKSFWKYDVAPNNVVLLESINNDNLPNILK